MNDLAPWLSAVFDNTLFYLGSWLLTYLVHSTLILLAAWLISRLVRFSSKSTHELLWKTALVAGIFTSTIQLLSGIEPSSGRHELVAPPSISATREIESADSLRVDLQHSLRNISFPSPVKQNISESSDLIQTSAQFAFRYVNSQQHGDRRVIRRTTRALFLECRDSSNWASSGSILENDSLKLGSILTNIESDHNQTGLLNLNFLLKAGVGLWLAIAFLLLMRLYLTRQNLMALVDQRAPVENETLQNFLTGLISATGHRWPVRLTHCDSIASPIVLTHHEICLPTRALSELASEEQKTMLAHEVAHIIRRDARWLKICAFFDHFLFFQPLNRLARRRIQESAEFLCDDWAIRKTNKNLPLARCLAQVATWINHQPRPVYHSAMSSEGRLLQSRVERILHHQNHRTISPIIPGILWSLLFSLTIYCAPAFALVPSSAHVYIYEFIGEDEAPQPPAFWIQGMQKSQKKYQFSVRKSAKSPPGSQISVDFTMTP